MVQKNVTIHVNMPALTKRMLIGVCIGLLAMSLLVFSVDHPRPEWGAYWQIRPMIVIALAGAAGGAFTYFMSSVAGQYGWNKVVTTIISFIVCLFGFWMGMVLGLNGTLWN